MIARLHRFYGGRPSDWLETPVGLLRAFLVMLPRLRAEEVLLLAESTALGSGVLGKEEHKKTASRWVAEAGGTTRRAQRLTPEELAMRLGQSGIVVG